MVRGPRAEPKAFFWMLGAGCDKFSPEIALPRAPARYHQPRRFV